MDTNPETTKPCSIGCKRCFAVTGENLDGGPAGWRLVLGAVWAFLVPGILALVGLGVLPILWPHRDSQALGGLGGLLVGMLLVGLLGRLVARHWRARPITEPKN